jgi:hypothetical protein
MPPGTPNGGGGSGGNPQLPPDPQPPQLQPVYAPRITSYDPEMRLVKIDEVAYKKGSFYMHLEDGLVTITHRFSAVKTPVLYPTPPMQIQIPEFEAGDLQEQLQKLAEIFIVEGEMDETAARWQLTNIVALEPQIFIPEPPNPDPPAVEFANIVLPVNDYWLGLLDYIKNRISANGRSTLELKILLSLPNNSNASLFVVYPNSVWFPDGTYLSGAEVRTNSVEGHRYYRAIQNVPVDIDIADTAYWREFSIVRTGIGVSAIVTRENERIPTDYNVFLDVIWDGWNYHISASDKSCIRIMQTDLDDLNWYNIDSPVATYYFSAGKELLIRDVVVSKRDVLGNGFERTIHNRNENGKPLWFGDYMSLSSYNGIVNQGLGTVSKGGLQCIQIPAGTSATFIWSQELNCYIKK